MTSYMRYYIIFGAVLIGVGILMGVIQMLLKVSAGGTSVVIPFVAAMTTAHIFVKTEQRAPNDADRKALTWGSFAVVLILNILIAALVLSAPGLLPEGGFSKEIWIFTGVLMLFFFGVTFFMIRWAYGSWIRKQAANILGKK